MHYFLKFIFGIKFYMFRTLLLSIIRSFSLYTAMVYVIQLASSRIRTELHFLPDLAARKLYYIHHCCVYSEKLLMMDRGSVRNM